MPLPGQTMSPMVRLGRTPEQCWTWIGPVGTSGYGCKTFCGRDMLAHRWIWEQLFGPIPKGLVVYHTCGIRTCVNPHHLALGAQADANRAGEATRLLPDDVAAIRAAKDDCPRTAARLAERYGVLPATIRDIWSRRSWGPRRRRKPHPMQKDTA